MTDVQMNGLTVDVAGDAKIDPKTGKPKSEAQLKKEAEKEAKRLEKLAKFEAKQAKLKEQEAQKQAKRQKNAGEEHNNSTVTWWEGARRWTYYTRQTINSYHTLKI